ncbi:MAG: TolB family protein [Chloroflexales bacterium]|nr:TolB family protein [Chloroflexales bacterium]
MSLSWIRHKGSVIASALLAGVAALGALPAGAAPFDGSRTSFADERFATVWSRTDSESVRSGRTWYWGPGPWFDYAEFYRQGENGLRTVQYFDKARMEINNPADRSGANRGVTNGLLVKELVSGRVQLGNDPFDTDQRTAADVPVAGNPRGDNPGGPGYSSFAGVATLDNGYRDPQRLGQRVEAAIDRGGNISVRPDLALPETEIVQFNSVTGHNIPRVFWEFLGQQGPILDGRVTNGPVVDWLFAMGLPITDAYWTRARVGASEQDVLVQLFERRVLTYVPSNPAGYKVEMGNVGQHYFQWRYAHLGTPWASPEPQLPLLYASNVDTGRHWELYRYDGGPGASRLTFNNEETVAFSWRRSWDPGQLALLVDSRRSNAQFRQIYEFGPVTLYDGDKAWNAQIRRLSYTDGTQPPPNGPYPGYLPNNVANEYNASYSPDGTKIVFVSDRMGGQELFIATSAFNGPTQLTSGGCVNETPTWSPDGRRLYWASNCDGDFELYRADVAYDYDSQYGVSARLVGVTNLTNNTTDDRFARVSPDGKYVAYSTFIDGTWDLSLLDTRTNVATVLFVTRSNDDAPSWSADSRSLAFASDRDGDYEIYTIGTNGANLTQITNNAAQDRWPLWAQ